MILSLVPLLIGCATLTWHSLHCDHSLFRRLLHFCCQLQQAERCQKKRTIAFRMEWQQRYLLITGALHQSLAGCDYDRKGLSVNFLCMDQTSPGRERPSSKIAIARAARFQEIFLDQVGWHASRQSSSRFLLDDRFDSILSPDKKEFKDGILEF